MDEASEVPWSDRAPQYMKDGELYSHVKFDDNGDPRRICVAQNQGRRGEFDVEGSTAVYDPNDVVGMPQADAEVKEYVESLPFVDDVEMNGGEA